ncbi:MAG: hypothetical protein AAFP19_04040 [Bacteroidota bacterium]
MEKSRLITVFKTLSKKDIREMAKFVRSPFFNQQEQVVRFFDYLVECQQELKIIPNKEQAFKKLFPNSPFDDVRIRLLMSALHKLIERYFIYSEVEEAALRSKIHLAAVYRKRNLPKHFERTTRDAALLQEKQDCQDADYYMNIYQLQWEHYQYLSTSQPTGELNLQSISDTLDTAFLAHKLRQTCFQLSHKAVYKSEYNISFLQELLRYIERKNFLEIPLIAIYYHCYHALIKGNQENHYEQFVQMLFEYSEHFSKSEFRDLYLLALNYCIKRINEGHEGYFQRAFDLYQKGLNNDFLLEDDRMSRFTYHNIVGAGLYMRAFGWVEGFIHNYKDKLARKYQDSLFSVNLARLEYNRQHYDKAMRLLNTANYKDLLLNLAAKTLLLKVYYELGELSLLESHLDAMKIFIRRKKVMGYHQSNYRNIIHYTQKLTTLNQYNKQERESLATQIEAEEILTERKWLLGQLAKMGH